MLNNTYNKIWNPEIQKPNINIGDLFRFKSEETTGCITCIVHGSTRTRVIKYTDICICLDFEMESQHNNFYCYCIFYVNNEKLKLPMFCTEPSGETKECIGNTFNLIDIIGVNDV